MIRAAAADPQLGAIDRAPVAAASRRRTRPTRPSRIDPPGPRCATGPGQDRTEEEIRWPPHDCACSPTPRTRPATRPHAPAVPIRLVDLYPLLAQAYRDNYVWLRDFEDDELLVSNDLFEVVRAFSDCRPSA